MTPDALLQEFLRATGAERESAALETLLSGALEPLVRAVVGRRLGGSTPAQDREDTAADALAELIERIMKAKTGQNEPITNLGAYAATTAHHSCDRYLRDRYPRRHRLRSRVRYFVENSVEHIAWQSASGEHFCALRAAQHASAPELSPNWFFEAPIPGRASESAIIDALLRYAQGPVPFDLLAEAVGHLTGIGDETPADWSTAETSVATDAPAIESLIDQRRRLERLWREICSLPVPQRRALLLNLRDESGNSALIILPATGVASMREIAVILEIDAVALAEIWGRLPLSDLEVAEKLGIQHQQVINLRKAARERLGRRLSSSNAGDGNIPGRSPSN